MNGKRSSLRWGNALLLLLSTWCAPAFADTDIRIDSIGATGAPWPGLAAWQDYAIYLISSQLCGNVADGERTWPDDACASIAVGMANSPGVAGFQDYAWYSLSSLSWDDFPPDEEIGTYPNALLTQARFNLPEAYNDQPPSVTGAQAVQLDTEPVPSSSASIRDDAIPGSLLVTILALIGIVAVARRDVAGRDHIRVAMNRSEAASIMSLRRDAEIMNGRLQCPPAAVTSSACRDMAVDHRRIAAGRD